MTERTEHAVTGELARTEDEGPVQIQLFEPVGYGIAERIRNLNVDELRPIEALQLLAELQKELQPGGAGLPARPPKRNKSS